MRRLSDRSAMTEARRFKTLILGRAIGSGAGGVALPQATAQNQMIIADATPAWTLLAAPAAEGQVPITGADPYTPAWGTTFPTVIQFNAGITFGGGTSINVVTVPDDAAQAVHVVDAGGIEYLRIVSTNAQPVIVFNEGGADVDVRIETSGSPDAVHLVGSTGNLGLGAAPGARSFRVYRTGGNATVEIESATDDVVFILDAPADEVCRFYIQAGGASRFQFRRLADSDNLDLYSHADGIGRVMNWEYATGYTDAKYLLTLQAGLTLYGATGANVVTVPDNVAQAMNIVDVGGIEYLRIISTDAQPVVVFNEGGADVDHRWEAVGVADALEIQGSDGQITLGVLTAGFVKSSAGGILSVSTEVALGELADYARGSIIAGMGANWAALAHPGAAGYALISDATDIVWDQTPVWTGEHSFADGIAFTGASDANEIYIPDNTAIALELLDAGFIEYLRIVSTDAQPVVVFNENAQDIDFRWEAVGQPNALFVQGSDGRRGMGTDDPAGEVHVIATAVTNVHRPAYGTPTLILDDGSTTAVTLQLAARDHSTRMCHIVMTAAPTTGDNKHWIISHLGPDASNRFSIGYLSSAATGFSTWADVNEHLIISTAGNFGINVAVPAYRFDVEDDIASHVAYFFNDGNNDTHQGIIVQCGLDTNPSAEFMRCVDGNGTTIGAIKGDGAGGTVLWTASDKRGKNVLGPIDRDLAMQALAKIDPIQYVGKNLTAKTGRKNVGFSAQDIYKYFPEVATYNEKADMYEMSYERLAPVLWAQNQELLKRIKQLEIHQENR